MTSYVLLLPMYPPMNSYIPTCKFGYPGHRIFLDIHEISLDARKHEDVFSDVAIHQGVVKYRLACPPQAAAGGLVCQESLFDLRS